MSSPGSSEEACNSARPSMPAATSRRIANATSETTNAECKRRVPAVTFRAPARECVPARVPERAMRGPARKKHWLERSQRWQKAVHANPVALLRLGVNHLANTLKRDEDRHSQASHRERHQRDRATRFPSNIAAPAGRGSRRGPRAWPTRARGKSRAPASGWPRWRRRLTTRARQRPRATKGLTPHRLPEDAAA